MKTYQYANYDIPMSRSVLDNGLTVITAEVPSLLVSVHLGFAVGALEDGPQRGIAHFLEHILIEGAGRDGVHPYFRELIQRGAENQAFTNWSDTAYLASGFAADTESIIDALMRIGFGVELDFGNNIERERGVVAQEIADRNQGLGRRMYGWATRRFYPSQPRLWGRIAGDLDSLKLIKSEDLFAHHRGLYKPSSAVIIVTGAVKHEAIVQMVLERSVDVQDIPAPSRPSIARTIVRDTFRDRDVQEKTILYFNAFPKIIDQYRESVFFNMIVDHPFGLLMQKLRLQEGGVYQMGWNGGDGFMSHNEISINAPPALFDHIEEELVRCLERISRGDIPDETWKTAMSQKRRHYATRPFTKETIRGRWLYERWLEGEIEDVDYGKLVLSSTRADFAKMAVELLSRGPFGRLDLVRS
jgi:predicted Zn-dependent peptidase